MRRLTCSLIFLCLVGCIENPKSGVPTSRPVDYWKGWETHPLTDKEKKRQEVLLGKIRWLITLRDDLAGKPADEYAELLSLADLTNVDGDLESYAYNVLGQGDSNEPTRAIIVVSQGYVVRANWPYSDY